MNTLSLYPFQNETGSGCLSNALWSPIRIGSRRDLKSGFHFGTGMLLALFLLPLHVYANADIDLGLSLGALTIKDSKMQESFRGDFYLQGHLGIRDKASGFEIRGHLGHYKTTSIHAADIGTDTQMEITPLTASLLYHIGDEKATIQPYIGGGVGAYFYGVKDSTFGSLESGSRFGPHLTAGVKLHIDPNFYIGAEYRRSFVSPVVFSKSTSFDQDMLTFVIGIQSKTEQKTKKSQENREKYEALLLTQINDLTLEIQKIKESKQTVETRINRFYESNLQHAYVNFFQVLDKPLVGQDLRITDPINKTVLAEGVIDSLTQSDTQITLLLRNDKGWQLPIVISKPSLALRISNTDYTSWTPAEVQKAIQVESLRDDEAFAQDLRRTQYLEGQSKRIDQSLREAEAQLATYHIQWKETQPKIETIVHEVQDRYRYHPEPVVHVHERDYPRHFEYRYYNPQDYVVPVYVPTTPPSLEERSKFIEAKKERIRSLRNR